MSSVARELTTKNSITFRDSQSADWLVAHVCAGPPRSIDIAVDRPRFGGEHFWLLCSVFQAAWHTRRRVGAAPRRAPPSMTTWPKYIA